MRKKRIESPHRTPFRINGNWERTWEEVSKELKIRNNIDLTPSWCKILCDRAQKKIVKELEEWKNEFGEKNIVEEYSSSIG